LLRIAGDSDAAAAAANDDDADKTVVIDERALLQACNVEQWKCDGVKIVGRLLVSRGTNLTVLLTANDQSYHT